MNGLKDRRKLIIIWGWQSKEVWK